MQTPQSIQDDKITGMLTAASEYRQETSSDLRRDMHLLQARVGAVEEAVTDNTKLTKGIGSDMREILGVFESWKGAMRALEMIGKLARPVSYIAAVGAAVASMWATLKSGGPRG